MGFTQVPGLLLSVYRYGECLSQWEWYWGSYRKPDCQSSYLQIRYIHYKQARYFVFCWCFFWVLAFESWHNGSSSGRLLCCVSVCNFLIAEVPVDKLSMEILRCDPVTLQH